jgi:predicted nucleic acid-binding protein
MGEILVDSNVILDLFEDDPQWAQWSEDILEQYSRSHTLCINPIIYSEISIGFKQIEELDEALIECEFKMLSIPKPALFLAGKAYLKYKRRKGTKNSPLPDFYIGAHAAVSKLKLITRDTARYRTYFSEVILISPETNP